MTFSIVARCPDSGQLGVGAVTATPGVGQLLAWAESGVGAVATQSWVNPYLGIDGIDLLHNGHTAQRALDGVVAMDEGRALRQVGVIDRHGRTAVWTGDECAAEAGDQAGDNCAVQGNLLETRGTLDACRDRFEAQAHESLVERIVKALEAGEAAGGDRRGSRSATVYVVDSERFPLWDLRVDYALHPLPVLRDLYHAFAAELLPQIRMLPTREDVHGSLTAADEAGLL